MRPVIPFLIVAFLSCLVVSQANAVTTVRLDYIGGSTAAGGTGGTSIDANASDLLSFDVSVEVDAAGVATLAFGLSWFDDANSDLIARTWETGTASLWP